MLDQSVLFGMADHDGHRDMRLDIDNMSYEVNENLVYGFVLKYFSSVSLLLYFVNNTNYIGFPGIVGPGRSNWIRKYWIK